MIGRIVPSRTETAEYRPTLHINAVLLIMGQNFVFSCCLCHDSVSVSDSIAQIASSQLEEIWKKERVALTKAYLSRRIENSRIITKISLWIASVPARFKLGVSQVHGVQGAQHIPRLILVTLLGRVSLFSASTYEGLILICRVMLLNSRQVWSSVFQLE